MADTPVASGLTVARWDDEFFVEWLTENRFSGEMGTNENNIIQVKEDLTKKKGDRIHFALVNKLTGAAVTGSDTLEGNEESMATRSFPVTVDKRRNGVRVAEIDEQFSAISLREAAKHVLKDWSLKDTERLIIQALASINGVNFATSTETQRDAWLTDNTDRVFDPSGTNGVDHSAIMDALDLTNDRLTAADVSAMKFKASTTANPRIRPIRTAANGRYYYILYAHPGAFKDLKTETVITQAQREVSLEMENNRLFQGGDLLWDGVIIKEIPEMHQELTTVFLNEGSGGTVDVAPCFLCGAQAIGMAWAKRWRSIEETFDYKDKHGVAIDSIYGLEKMQFGSGTFGAAGTGDRDDLKDHGVVTGYFAIDPI